MHAIKGSWVGQTFALAKCNDSGGKKSRIRRSKEERKALVESYIKKYQKLNNGTFPSLNLTHKEVGGSFYTVRELVREAIQENRVLGPAKLTSNDQSLDGFLEQSPLGSICVEPEAALSSSNGSQIVTHLVPNPHQDVIEELVLDSSVHNPESEYQRFDEGKNVNGSSQVVEENEVYLKALDTESQPMEVLESKAEVRHPHKDTSEELVLESSVQCPESEHQRFDEGKNINGSSQVVEKTQEYDKALYTESQSMATLELDENVAELEASKGKVIHVTTDVMVEKFPLTSGSKITYGLDENYSEHNYLTQTLVEEKIDRVETGEVKNSSVVVDMNLTKSTSDLRKEKATANSAGSLLEKNSGLVDEKPVDNLEAPVLRNLNDSTTREGTILETRNGRYSEVEDVLPAGTKVVIDAPVGIDGQSPNGNMTSTSPEQAISKKEIASKSNPNLNQNIANGSISPKGSNPTLDRMNLESWETISKKPAKPAANPLLVFIESFIAAFVKFWSE